VDSELTRRSRRLLVIAAAAAAADDDDDDTDAYCMATDRPTDRQNAHLLSVGLLIH